MACIQTDESRFSSPGKLGYELGDFSETIFDKDWNRKIPVVHFGLLVHPRHQLEGLRVALKAKDTLIVSPLSCRQ